jgi:hypothetical protein
MYVALCGDHNQRRWEGACSTNDRCEEFMNNFCSEKYKGGRPQLKSGRRWKNTK